MRQSREQEHPLAVGGRDIELLELGDRTWGETDLHLDGKQGPALRVAHVTGHGTNLRGRGLCLGLLRDFQRDHSVRLENCLGLRFGRGRSTRRSCDLHHSHHRVRRQSGPHQSDGLDLSLIGDDQVSTTQAAR